MRLLLAFLFAFTPLYSNQCQIKAVAFDWGGVMGQGNREPLFLFIQNTFNISKEEIRDLAHRLNRSIEKGGDERRFLKEYARLKGVTLNSRWFERYAEAKKQAVIPIPGMTELVDALKEAGYQTPLLSNVEAYPAKILSDLGYYSHFSPVLLSYQMGVKKPAPKAYQKLLEATHLPACSVIFIDDKVENVEAARRVGIDAILFMGRENLIEELKKRGIEAYGKAA